MATVVPSVSDSSFCSEAMSACGTALAGFFLPLTGTRPAASGNYIATTEQGSHAYHNLVESFQRWPAALFYVVVMALLGLHLVHGLWSVVNDLGATGTRVRQTGAAIAWLLAVAVAIGNITIPIAVLTGLVN